MARYYMVMRQHEKIKTQGRIVYSPSLILTQKQSTKNFARIMSTPTNLTAQMWRHETKSLAFTCTGKPEHVCQPL